jgi:ABC-type branched-subunit amino acid transport system substrate-binding protein
MVVLLLVRWFFSSPNIVAKFENLSQESYDFYAWTRLWGYKMGDRSSSLLYYFLKRRLKENRSRITSLKLFVLMRMIFFMDYKQLYYSSVFLFTAFLLSGSVFSEENEVFQVGIITPSTGKFQEAGQNCLQGYQLAISEVESRIKEKLTFIYEDDLSSTQGAVRSFQRILNGKQVLASMLLGSYAGLALNPISLKHKIPLLGFVGHDDFVSGNPYAFTYWIATALEAKFIYKYVLEKKYRKVALITLENDFSLSIRKHLVDKFRETDIKILFDEIFFDEVDFKSQIEKLRHIKPDLLILSFTGDTYPVLLKQLYTQRINIPKISIAAGMSNEYLRIAGPPEVTNGIVSYTLDSHDFLSSKNQQEKYSLPAYAFACYTGMKFFLNTVSKLARENNVSREALARELTVAKEVNLGFNRFPILERQIQYPLRPFIVENYALIPLTK